MKNGQEQILAQVEGLYGGSSQPAAVVNGSLLAVWANAAAQERYDLLHRPDGIRGLIPGEHLKQVEQALRRGQAQAVRCAALGEKAPALAASLCFTPLEGSREGPLALVNFQQLSTDIPLPGAAIHQMVSALSGHIRGPLNTIFALLILLARKQEAQHDRSLHDRLSMISRQCYHILRHCQNLTQFALLGAGQQDVSPAAGDLALTLGELCASAREKMWEIGIPLEFVAKAPTVYCLYDEELLQAAFLNLISNACRYSREGNAVRVTLEARGQRALIHIADHGSGIPAQALEHIFEPFFSLPDQNGEPGCGLGLTVAKMCMAAQGGSISIESKEGRGTTAALSLPLAPPAQELTLQSPRSTDALCNHYSPLHVLLADVCTPPDPWITSQ